MFQSACVPYSAKARRYRLATVSGSAGVSFMGTSFSIEAGGWQGSNPHTASARVQDGPVWKTDQVPCLSIELHQNRRQVVFRIAGGNLREQPVEDESEQRRRLPTPIGRCCLSSHVPEAPRRRERKEHRFPTHSNKRSRERSLTSNREQMPAMPMAQATAKYKRWRRSAAEANGMASAFTESGGTPSRLHASPPGDRRP